MASWGMAAPSLHELGIVKAGAAWMGVSHCLSFDEEARVDFFPP